MSDDLVSDDPNERASRAGELLRRVAQIVAFSEGNTLEVEVGDTDALLALQDALSGGLPPSLEAMYSESDPVSLVVPLPGEDLDFLPLKDVADVVAEESLDASFVPFARAGKTLLCVRVPTEPTALDGGVVAMSRLGTEWEEEPAGVSLDDFLAALVEILDRLTSTSTQVGEANHASSESQPIITLGDEIPPEKLVEIESALEEIDPDHAEFWMSLLS